MNEGVHDVHGFLGNTNVGVDLLEHLVDVDREGLDSSSSGFLVSSVWLLSLGRFLSHIKIKSCTNYRLDSILQM